MNLKMNKINDKNKAIGKQYKSFDVKEYTFDKESRTISGYAAIFGNIDKANDMLIKGCFAKSINERGPESNANDKIILLWMHDMSEPIGKITKLIEDDRGLYFEATIDNIELGDRTLIQLESGTLNQFSIGYTYVWDKCEWQEIGGEQVFIVNEVVLYEISVVSIGCNGLTEYTGLKSISDIEDAFSALQDEITNELKGLSTNKKSAIQGILSKAWALAKVEPVEESKGSLKSPLDGKQAEHNNDIFSGIKFNNLNNMK